MAETEMFDAAFASSRYMAIFRGLGLNDTLDLAKCAWRAGIQLVEVPVQSPDDLETLRALVQLGEEEGRLVGAGTVRSVEQVDLVRQAGARFLVTPGFSARVLDHAERRGLPVLPGVATASEVDAGLERGLRWLKAFPAAVLGAEWITQMHGPFPEARFVATGGMSLANAQQFLDAGAEAVAIGSAVRDLVAER